MNKNSPRKPPTPIEAERTTPELEQEIRRRAYELYEHGGRVAGYELDDWLQAEAELLSVKSRETAA
jgi:hypothetical protein